MGRRPSSGDGHHRSPPTKRSGGALVVEQRRQQQGTQRVRAVGSSASRPPSGARNWVCRLGGTSPTVDACGTVDLLFVVVSGSAHAGQAVADAPGRRPAQAPATWSSGEKGGRGCRPHDGQAGRWAGRRCCRPAPGGQTAPRTRDSESALGHGGAAAGVEQAATTGGDGRGRVAGPGAVVDLQDSGAADHLLDRHRLVAVADAQDRGLAEAVSQHVGLRPGPGRAVGAQQRPRRGTAVRSPPSTRAACAAGAEAHAELEGDQACVRPGPRLRQVSGERGGGRPLPDLGRGAEGGGSGGVDGLRLRPSARRRQDRPGP